MKHLRGYLPAVLTWIAYVDMVAACFATVMQLRDLALLLTYSGLCLVVAAFCYAAAGDDDGR